MGKYEKLKTIILSGKSDKNINFNELCNLLIRLGFELDRIKGDHHIFKMEGIEKLIDLQPDKKDSSKAKSYQVAQVRKFIEIYL